MGEIARTLFLNGASFNANTFYDWTSYFETLAADRLELAIELEADRMAHSRIDKADLDSEMTVVRSELEGGENDPETPPPPGRDGHGDPGAPLPLAGHRLAERRRADAAGRPPATTTAPTTGRTTPRS